MQPLEGQNRRTAKHAQTVLFIHIISGSLFQRNNAKYGKKKSTKLFIAGVFNIKIWETISKPNYPEHFKLIQLL